MSDDYEPIECPMCNGMCFADDDDEEDELDDADCGTCNGYGWLWRKKVVKTVCKTKDANS